MLLNVEYMTSDFEEYLLGNYNNIRQAQSNPTVYAQLCVSWEEIDGGYRSKNYYRRDGPNKPYRQRNHKIVEISDTEVIVENYDLEWTRCESCDMIFKRSDNGWHGKLLSEDKCIVRGAKLIAEIHLTGDGLNSRDRGEDTEGNKIFGGNSLYKFKRGK